MKKKVKIEVEIDERFQEVCKRFNSTPKEIFKQLQNDFMGIQDSERVYEVIVAQLYLSQSLARKGKVDRGTVENILDFMRSYHAQLRKEEAIPSNLSQVTQSLLEECKYDRKHTNN